MTTGINISKKLEAGLRATGRKIGNTRLIPVRGLHRNEYVRIYAKAEWEQLSGSIKARAAFYIIRHAVLQGMLDEHITLLDATSGNTGIAYAAIGRELGIPVALCLPENATKERKETLEALGAQIIYTSKFGGTDEAQEVAADLALRYPGKYFYASQYTNEQNWKAHYYGTAEEIIRAAPDASHFVAGLGTTGTFTGTARRLKEINPLIQAISLQPDLPLHGLEGWKHLETAIVPKIYDASVADRDIAIPTSAAYEVLEKVYRAEGLLLSPSSAANIAGAIQVADSIDTGTVVTVLPDNADRYSEVVRQIIPS